MKKLFVISLSVTSAAIAIYLLFIKEPVFHATGGYLTNLNDKGIILEGYDPVAYFTENKPKKGDAQFTFEYKGARYLFASADNLNQFTKEPQKFAPQYGAFCGYALSIGKLRPVDPMIFQIKDGRLILQHTKEAYDLFNEDLNGNTLKAENNWPGIVSAHLGKPVQYDKQAPASTASTSSSK